VKGFKPEKVLTRIWDDYINNKNAADNVFKVGFFTLFSVYEREGKLNDDEELLLIYYSL
jgi:hypothetical protein